MKRLEGIVRRFVPWMGYGFISHPEHGDDIFVHQSQIIMNGYRELLDGESVQFDLKNGPKGLHAENVIRVLPELPKPQVTHEVLKRQFVS